MSKSNTLGQRLHDLRVARGMSLEQVALRSGITKQAVHQIERGEINGRVATLRKIGKALGVPLAEFII